MAVKSKPKPVKGAAARKAKQTKLTAARDAEERRIMGVVNAATDSRYGGADRVLGDELRRTSAHGATIDGAYADYQKTVAGLQAQQAAAMRDAATAQAQTAGAVSGMQAQLGAGQAQQTTDTAARYGLDGGQQAAEAAQLAGQLGAVQGARSQAQAGTSAAIGLAQSDRLRQSALAGVGGQLRDRSRNQNEIKLLGQKKLDLAKDKGDYATTLRNELDKQQSELDLGYAALGQKASASDRDAELELLGLQIRKDESKASNRLAQSRLDQTAAQNKQTNADRASDNARADRALDDTIEDRAGRRAQRDRELDAKSAKGDTPKLTPAKKDEWRQKKYRVLDIRTVFKTLTSGQQRFTSTAEVSVHLKKAGYNRLEINMARDMGVLGHLSAHNLRAAKGYFPGGIIPQAFLGG